MAAQLTRDSVTDAARYFDSWLGFRQRALRLPGVQAAVWFEDDLVLSVAHGSADVEAGVALTTEHLFRIASHSKTFTATAILQLAERERLRLDDRVGSWLPWLSPESGLATITLRELLAHGGGVVRDGHDGDFWQLAQPFPDELQLRDMCGDGAAIRPANERFKYSNVGYALLGLVVEAASGAPYNAYVSTEIVQRLALQHTSPELDAARVDEYATGYTSLAYADRRVPVEHVDTRAMSPATGFTSTAEDVCRYASAHFLGDTRLLGDASKRLMQREEWKVEGDDRHYGLGLAVSRIDDRRMVGHGGAYPGHATRTLFDPEARFAVSVFTNAIDGAAQELATAAVRLAELAAAAQTPPTRAEADLQHFTGRFANLWGVMDVVDLGGRLLALDPTQADPAEDITELAVEDRATLRIVKSNGYGSFGERLRYTFASDGAVTSVRGNGAMTSYPLDAYAAAVADRERVSAQPL